MNKIVLPQAELYFIENSIIKLDLLHNEEMNLDQMKEIVDAVNKLADGKPHCILVDVRTSLGFSSNEARQYAADNSYPPNKIADAIILDRLPKN